MSNFTGMDIQGVRNLGTQMRAKADDIDGLMSQLTSQLSSTQWVGNDRQQFESDWSSQHCTALRNVSQALRDAAARADQNATAQENTSNVG